MKNCGRIHQKRTKIDRLMNKLVMLVRGLPWALGRDGGGGTPPRPRLPPPGPQFPSCAEHSA